MDLESDLDKHPERFEMPDLNPEYKLLDPKDWCRSSPSGSILACYGMFSGRSVTTTPTAW
jgi:hypothetical protein